MATKTKGRIPPQIEFELLTEAFAEQLPSGLVSDRGRRMPIHDVLRHPWAFARRAKQPYSRQRTTAKSKQASHQPWNRPPHLRARTETTPARSCSSLSLASSSPLSWPSSSSAHTRPSQSPTPPLLPPNTDSRRYQKQKRRTRKSPPILCRSHPSSIWLTAHGPSADLAM